MKKSCFVTTLLVAVSSVPSLAQTVNVQSGAAAATSTEVRTGPGGGQSIDVKSGAAAQSGADVRVGPDGGVSVKTRAKAATETSVTVGADPNRPPPRPQSMPQPYGTPLPLAAPPPNTAYPPPQPEVIYVEALPLPPGTDPAMQPPPKPRPPLPCKKTVEAVNGDLRITIVNNYCTVKITIRSLWREGGKTHVEFEADNAKGGQQAHLKLVEQWTDRSGRAVVDAIDEQKIAIGKGRNIVFSVAGPTPAAVGGTLTLYK